MKKQNKSNQYKIGKANRNSIQHRFIVALIDGNIDYVKMMEKELHLPRPVTIADLHRPVKIGKMEHECGKWLELIYTTLEKNIVDEEPGTEIYETMKYKIKVASDLEMFYDAFMTYENIVPDWITDIRDGYAE